jgi:hypothetical protein
MQHRWSHLAGRPAVPETAGMPQSPNLSDPRWWETCARTQIISHPRVALGLALAAGLMVGYWVKR